MRFSPRPYVPSLLLLLVLGSGCMGPEYPDEFDETTQPSGALDAAIGPVVVAVADAGNADAALTPPSSGSGGLPEAGGTFPGGPPSDDAGSTAPLRDAATLRDASGAPEASVPVEAGTSAEAGVNSDAGSMVPPSSAISSCSISASTDASTALRYRGKYGCAVWIANASNKVVKAFLVATIISSRSGVPTYRSQASGVSVDVTTSATLGAARQHMYTWNAANAAPGKYTLNVETHSENGVKLVAVPFDTSRGPVSATGTPNVDIRAAAIDCK